MTAKKSKTKFKKFEKTDGYSDIEKAIEYENNKKVKSAIKFYKIGIKKLETATIKITNAIEKRERMAKIETFRQTMFKLERKKQKKADLKVREKNRAMSPKHSRQKTKPLEALPGYEHIVKGNRAETNHDYEKAIALYDKGIAMLEPTLLRIDNAREKEDRRDQLEEIRHKRQRCQIRLDQQNRVKKTIEHTRFKARAISKEPGYALCKKGHQMEKQRKYDAAIRYYKKGITQLENTLKDVDNSIERRKRVTVIDQYRHSMQKLKNKKTRRKSGSATLITSTKTKPKNVKPHPVDTARIFHNSNSSLSRIKLLRVNSGASLTNSPGIMAAPSILTPRTSSTGGQLYQFIRDGNLASDVIQKSARSELFFMMPVIISSIIHVPLPFYACLRDPMMETFNAKIESIPSLEQRLRFFLYSFHENIMVQEFFGDHPSMPSVVDDQESDDSHSAGNKPDEDIKNDGDDNKDGADDEPVLATISCSSSSKFEEHYFERDTIWYLRTLCESKPELESEHLISNDLQMWDPMGKDHRIHKIKIKKVFKSKAKPILVSTYQKLSDTKYRPISQFIIKRGDDLRKDSAALHIFRFMNSIWQEENLYYDGYSVRCLIYAVLPMGPDFGCIEYIPGCLPLKHINEYKGKLMTPMVKNLVATAAASYIASFVLGVRDRHFENVLIRSDGTLFHIDFGFVMGESLFLDASKIAITSDLQELMEDHWDAFVEIGTKAFMKLRLHYNEIVEYARIVFDFVQLESPYETFLYKMLHMEDDNAVAKEYMRKKLQNAPNAWNTKIKNVVHTVAQTTIG